MKEIYSIGYKDSYNNFTKVWEKGKGRAIKFATIEETRKHIEDNKEYYLKHGINKFKIMQGWKVIEEVEMK